MEKKYKLAILASHPVTYHVPIFRKLAKHPRINLTVYFCSDFGVKKADFDPGFGRKIKWDLDLLSGYKYKFLKNYSLNPNPSTFFGLINPGIIRELLKNKYDAIIVYGYFLFTNWLAFLGAWLTKTPIFLRGENPLNQEFLSKIKFIIKNLILRVLFKMITGFLYIGRENKKFYQFYGVQNKKLFFTPYAVENERFTKEYKVLQNQKNLFKKILGIDKTKVVILFVGKLIHKKRPLTLLKAFEKIKFKNKALVFVGDGILKKCIMNYIKNKKLKNIYLVGFKTQRELPKYYLIGDILVLPSGIGETWGLVVNEGMCFKLPIVVSDIVGCGSDLVKHNKNGFVFHLDNIEELAKCIEILLKNPKKRKQFGEISFKIVQKYNYDKDINGIFKALKNLK